jgi:hypothetical protein
MLLQRLGQRDLPSRHVRLNPEFMHRESCGCADDGEPTNDQ